jgi:hypothetical protein
MAKSVGVIAWESLLVNAGDLATDLGNARRSFFATLFTLHKTPPLYASLEISIEELTRPYLAVLVETRRALLFTDEHGQVQHRAWSRELGHFITEMVMPRLGQDSEFAWRRLPYVARRIDAMIAAAD